MKYKLLVLDVDGTLLNDAKEISKRTLASLLKVQQMGIRVALASGRPTYGLMPLAKTLELGNYGGFIISYNGGQIINAQNGEILFERRINPEMLPYLEKKARKNNFAIFTYHDDTILTDSSDNEHVHAEANLNNLKIIQEEEFSTAIDFAPCKCILVSNDEEALKELEHQHLQSELQYLKYQINPHFFMNTLNNIHALVDMDAGKAKRTIVELSKLMRYVLYEASNRTILLSREIQFLDNYIALMKLRYTGRVRIECCMPDEVPEVQIPPLLFISFVENAFKHGVSYQEESFIRVFMSVEDGRLAFRCSNSNHGRSVEQHHGIGLENIRKRLRLLFGQDYTLSINERDDSFNVLLIIPLL